MEIICLQLKEIYIESIYTLSYILKLYPLLRGLKSIKNHCKYIESRLRGSAEIETVELFYLTVLGESNLLEWNGPDMTLHVYPVKGKEFYISSRHWVFQNKDRGIEYPILDSLMECGRILCSKLRLRSYETVVTGELELIAYFSYLEIRYFRMGHIKSGFFHIRSRDEIRSAVWNAISTLFENILNYEHLMWCHLYTVKMSTISI